MAEVDNTHLVQECMRVEGDCEYTAEAHFIIAAKAGWVSFLVKLIPAAAAAASGAALLSGAPDWIGWFSVIAGVAFALQSIMDPDKKREEHSQAGKSYTALKHESRALHETFSKEIDHDSFHMMVRIIREKYNQLVKLTPQTTEKEFEEGRVRIKAGRHKPDYKEDESEAE